MLRHPLLLFCIFTTLHNNSVAGSPQLQDVCEAQPPRPVCLMSRSATQAFRSLPQDTTTRWLSRKRLAQGRPALASGQSSQIRQIQQRPTEATYSNFSLPFLESMSGCVVVERVCRSGKFQISSITSPRSVRTGPAMHSGHLILSVSAEN